MFSLAKQAQIPPPPPFFCFFDTLACFSAEELQKIAAHSLQLAAALPCLLLIAGLEARILLRPDIRLGNAVTLHVRFAILHVGRPPGSPAVFVLTHRSVALSCWSIAQIVAFEVDLPGDLLVRTVGTTEWHANTGGLRARLHSDTAR